MATNLILFEWKKLLQLILSCETFFERKVKKIIVLLTSSGSESYGTLQGQKLVDHACF